MSDESTAESANSTATMEPSPATQTAPVQDAGTASAQAEPATSAPPTVTPDTSGSSSATPKRSAAELLEAAIAPIGASPKPIPPPPVPAPVAPSEDYQKRYQEAQTYIGRMSNELGALRKQAEAYQGLPPADQLRQTLAQQQAVAQAAKLTPFSARHPEHHQTMGSVQRWKAFDAAFKAAPSEVQTQEYRNRLAQSMGVSNKDYEAHQAYEAHSANVKQRLETDPENFIGDMVDQRVNAILAQRDQYQGVRTATEAFLSQNQPLVEKYRDLFVQGLDEHTPRAAIIAKLAQAQEEIAALRAGVTKNVQQVETAKAQIQATQGKATVRRDAAPTAPADLQTAIKATGITPSRMNSREAAKLLDTIHDNIHH